MLISSFFGKYFMVDKKESNIKDLVRVCNEALNVSKKHSYLWEDDSLWVDEDSEENLDPDKLLYLASGFIAQDESFCIYITKNVDRFVFSGRNFSDNGNGLTAKEAALAITNYFKGYGITSDYLRKSFYDSLSEPLGRYLAKRSIKKLNRQKTYK